MLKVTVDASKVMKQLEDMPQKIRASLYKSIYASALKLQKHVVVDKLQGQVLKKQSGNLARSIQNQVIQTDQGITGRVYSSGDVKYAAIHEFGGRIPPHIIEPKNAEALSFIMGGKRVFFKRVNHPGSDMPERSFMRSSLKDMREEIITSMEKAVAEATKL